MDIVILIGLLLLIMGIVFYIISYGVKKTAEVERKTYGVPSGRITYSDLDKPAKALFSKRYLLVGKPDYLVRTADGLVPVELKSGRVPESPYRSHILQLASYCLLVEDTYGIRVPYGIIVYSNGIQHRIDFYEGLRRDLFQTIDIMRTELKTNMIQRNHTSNRRCAYCSLAHMCENKIT